MTYSSASLAFVLLMHAGSAFAAGSNWMTPLNGTLPLSQLSIPGTHDSGARFEPLSGTAKCQNLTIREQLDSGVRFLDIRCRHVNDAFTIHHGHVYQNINFTDVLGATYGFLDANPGETVIMSVKEEYQSSGNTRSFEATFDSYVALNAPKWRLASAIPTLGEARGKIVLFRRFGATSTPKGIDASHWPDNTTFSTGNTLRVQDHYAVSDNDTKWKQILATLNEARDGANNTLHVNFTSGYISGLFGIPNIPGVSKHIHPRLSTFFTAHPNGRFGIIVMDFADAAMAALVYNTNIPPAPDPPVGTRVSD
jgi:1-phosphatidylinositol phosphodiesterase